MEQLELHSAVLTRIKKYYPVFLTAFFLACLSLYWFVSCNTRTFLALAVLATIAASALVFSYCKGLLSSKKNPTLALAVVLSFFALVYTFAFPPFTVPDEGHHFFSSYWLSDVLTGQITEDGFLVRETDWDLFIEMPDTAIDSDDYKKILSDFELFQSDQSIVPVDYFQFSLGSENPPAKIATTIAILFAKFLNLGTYPMFYLGRIFNAISFILCVVAAYRVIPLGKNLVVALALLPMTLHLTASYSYDVGIISLGLLVTSLMLKGIFGTGLLPHKLAGAIILTSALLAPCKVIYSTLLLLVFFIPSTRFTSRRSEYLFKASVFVIPAIMILVLRSASIGGLASASSTLDYRGAESGHFYELSYIFQDPLSFMAMLARTFIVQGDFFWTSALGRSLGWFQSNIAVPFFYCIPLLIGIIYSAQKDSEDQTPIPPGLKITFIILTLLSFFGSVLSMFIGHTFDTEPIIQGVQGRYILPAALPLLLALRSRYISIDRDTFPVTIVIFSITNVIFLLHIVASALI